MRHGKNQKAAESERQMRLIMARRLDPRSVWEAQSYGNEPRTIQLEISDSGEMHTRWGPVGKSRVAGQKVYMTQRSRTTDRTEDFIIPLAELERLQSAPDWQHLPDVRPTAYWRRLSREGYAQLSLRPDPQGQLRGDYILLTIYQCMHWFDDGSCFTTWAEFVSGEGNEGAFDQASTWSQQVERGELLPLARLQFVDVPLAVGTPVRIIDGGWNNKPPRIDDKPRNWSGKEAVIVEAGRQGGYYQVPGTQEWRTAGEWYVECEGERLKFSLHSPNEISASYYTLTELNANPNASLDEIGQATSSQQYHVADHYALRQRLEYLGKQAGHATLAFQSAADLLAWLPTYRVIDRPQPREKEG